MNFPIRTILFRTFVTNPNWRGPDSHVPDDRREDLGRVDVADAESSDAGPPAEDVQGHYGPLVRVLAPVEKTSHWKCQLKEQQF